MMFKTGLILSLMFGFAALYACQGDKEPAQTKTPGAPPPGMQALSNPGASQLETLKAGLAKDPENEGLLAQLGDAYFEARQFEAAIPIYERLVAVNPKNADGFNDLGLSHFYLGKGEDALAAIAKANAADPTFQRAWLSKGFILVSLKRYPEAIAPLNKVKELDPNGKLAQTAEGFLETIREQQGRPQQ